MRQLGTTVYLWLKPLMKGHKWLPTFWFINKSVKLPYRCKRLLLRIGTSVSFSLAFTPLGVARTGAFFLECVIWVMHAAQKPPFVCSCNQLISIRLMAFLGILLKLEEDTPTGLIWGKCDLDLPTVSWEEILPHLANRPAEVSSRMVLRPATLSGGRCWKLEKIYSSRPSSLFM